MTNATVTGPSDKVNTTAVAGRISQGYSIRKRSGRPAPSAFQPLFDGREPAECLRIRQHLYEQCWSTIQQIFKGVKREAEQSAVKNIVDYVCNSYKPIGGGADCSGVAERSLNCADQLLNWRLPVGMVCTGINHYDYDGTFDEIVGTLESGGQHRVAVVKESDASSLKSLLRSIIRQFVEGCGDEDDADAADSSSSSSSDEEELCCDEDGGKDKRKQRWRQSKTDLAKQLGLKWFDLQLLEEWFQGRYRQKHGAEGRLVILVPNLMSLDTAVISSLIQMLQLPIVLLLGVAVLKESAVNDLLPDACLNCIRIEYFQLSDSTITFGNLVNELFIKCDESNQIPVKLSTALLEFVNYSFESCNYSLADFIRNIHYACLFHFYASPLSILLQSRAGWPAVEHSICHNHLELVRSLPSMRIWMERLVGTAAGSSSSNDELEIRRDKADIARRMLEDDLYLLNRLPEMLESVRVYQRRFHAALECLLYLTQRFKKSPYKRSRLQLFLQCMDPTFVQSDYLLQVMRLSRFLTESSIQDLFQFCRDYNPSFDELFAGDLGADRWRQLSERLQKIIDENGGGDRKKLEERMSFYRRDFQAFLVEFFGRHLQHYSSQPLHELFYCAATSRLKKAFQPQPRASIHSALAYPSYYLACDCCADDQGSSWKSEDICVAYQIYLESGQQINLHDWYVGFSEILQVPAGSRKKSLSVDEKAMFARFIRCVSDLEFMGYIRDNSRKADHVLRLTWGMK